MNNNETEKPFHRIDCTKCENYNEEKRWCEAYNEKINSIINVYICNKFTKRGSDENE